MKLTETEKEARSMLCLPLDGLVTREAYTARVKEFSPVVRLFKVGFGSFTRFGLDALDIVKDHGAEVFLDLKYHDIPATVRDAAMAATEHGVYMFNVHASGGEKMMAAALEGAKEASEKAGKPLPRIVAVTVLTSFDEASYLKTFEPLNPALANLKLDWDKYSGMKKDDEELQADFNLFMSTHDLTGVIQKQVAHLAGLARQQGLHGMVSSAADLCAVRPTIGPNFIYVTPGIEGVSTPAGADQKRVFSPGNAVRQGASILVVGRAMTGQKTPEERLNAGYQILQDMAKALEEKAAAQP